MNEDKFDLKDVFKELISKNEMLGYEVYNRFYEIGSFKGIEETKEYLLKHKN
jgi:NDP-sugar pyrophosphorylase family protein